jgi:glycosyltransferase involved in cell wall biosynthesis
MRYSVFISYQYFPYYRLPILKMLARDTDIDYTFIAGLEPDIEIKIIDETVASSNSLKWVSVRNLWLFNKKILWQRGLLKVCTSGELDSIIFLASPYYLTTWIGIIIARLRKKKVFLWGHFTLRNDWRDSIKLLFYKLADGLLLYGNWAKDQLVQKGLNPKKLFVIYNSLDYEQQKINREKLIPEYLTKIKQELFSNPELPILLFIGRLVPVKKLDELLYAVKKLHEIEYPVNLLIIGDGGEKQKLERLVVDQKLENYVLFFGECFQEETIAPLISLSDLCVSPGNVGLAALHSLVYGTPVITHNNPIFQGPEFEIISAGINGAFYTYGSVDSLVNSIENWLKSKKNMRNEIRESCYEPIDKFYNPRYQAEVIRFAIREILDEKSDG